jgi:hypothetical protein
MVKIGDGEREHNLRNANLLNLLIPRMDFFFKKSLYTLFHKSVIKVVN